MAKLLQVLGLRIATPTHQKCGGFALISAQILDQMVASL